MGNVSNEAHIGGNPLSISKAEMEKIIIQMNKSICKIYYNNTFGTGFFCNIPISDQNQNTNYFLALITCNHVINKKIKGNIIELIINEVTYPLFIDETRKVFIDEMKDIIIIEIRKGELLNINSLYLDENIFNKNPESIYKYIYILHFEYGKEAKYSTGVIDQFDNILIFNQKILYSCTTQPGSSGGPIINSRNYKVIGVHRGFDKAKGLNSGLFISIAILKFQKEFGNKLNNNEDNNDDINNDNINNYINNNGDDINININFKNNLNNGEGENYENIFQNFQKNNINQNNFIFNNNFNPNINNIEYNDNKNNINQNNFIYNNNPNFNNVEFNFNKNNKIKNINNNIYNKVNNLNNNIYPNINDIDNNINISNNSNNIQNNNSYNYPNNHNKINNNPIGNNIKPNINFNQINGIHEHPLLISKINDKSCNICLQKLNNKLSGVCHSCLIIICQNCLQNIFNRKPNIKIHPHKLKLKYNKDHWDCMQCYFTYGDDKCVSLYCEQCNLNFCDLCYLSEENNNNNQENKQENNHNEQENNKNENNNNSSHEHSLINVKLNEICYFCCNKIDNVLGYKCEKDDMTLCEDCYVKIFVHDDEEPNNNLHNHELELLIREDWYCDICKDRFINKISYCCLKCNFDVCYYCYYKKKKNKNVDNEEKEKEDEEEDDVYKEYIRNVVKAGKAIDECYQQ